MCVNLDGTVYSVRTLVGDGEVGGYTCVFEPGWDDVLYVIMKWEVCEPVVIRNLASVQRR